MKKMNDKESKKVLIDLLKCFDKICRDNGIKYSLIGGSLIGAIRHKGMIPWDDDIDVILIHSEYKKLLKVIENYNDGIYNFCGFENNDTYYYPYLKLIDTRTLVEDSYKKIEDYGVYLDIFCYNKLPENKLLAKIHYMKIMMYKIIISGHATIVYKNKDRLILFKKIGLIISKIFGIKFILKRYNKMLEKYNKKESRYIISNWPCYGLDKERQKNKNLNEYIDYDFESIKAMISKEYDEILKTTFNDYMKLPPKEKRINHNMKFFWKDSIKK